MTRSGSTAAARNAFVTTSTRFRSVRSTTTPAKTPNTTAGRIASRMRIEEDVFDFVISPTNTMRAKVVAFAATWDRICAPQSARKARLRRMPRSEAPLSWSIGVAALLGLGGQRSALDESFDIALQLPPADEDPAAAGRAAHPDVRAEPHDAPGVAPAGMRLPQHDDVVEVQGQRRLRHPDGQSRRDDQRWERTAATSRAVCFATVK